MNCYLPCICIPFNTLFINASAPCESQQLLHYHIHRIQVYLCLLLDNCHIEALMTYLAQKPKLQKTQLLYWICSFQQCTSHVDWNTMATSGGTTVDAGLFKMHPNVGSSYMLLRVWICNLFLTRNGKSLISDILQLPSCCSALWFNIFKKKGQQQPTPTALILISLVSIYKCPYGDV